MRKLAVTVLCLSAVGLVSTTAQADVLIAGAADAGWTGEVASTVMATGLIENADVFDLRYGTPTLVQLQQYSAVMAFTDYGASFRRSSPSTPRFRSAVGGRATATRR